MSMINIHTVPGIIQQSQSSLQQQQVILYKTVIPIYNDSCKSKSTLKSLRSISAAPPAPRLGGDLDVDDIFRDDDTSLFFEPLDDLSTEINISGIATEEFR